MQIQTLLTILALLPNLAIADDQPLPLTPDTDLCQLHRTLNRPENLPARCKPCPMPGQCKGSAYLLPAPKRAQLENAYFNNGSAQLTDLAKDGLDRAALVMREGASSGESYVIEGHANRTGPYRLNQRLSERRAEAVKHYLVARGVEPARLDSRGYSYAYPLDKQHPEDGVNRRVELANRTEARQQ